MVGKGSNKVKLSSYFENILYNFTFFVGNLTKELLKNLLYIAFI
ncbi:MAG: hypothetical protein ACEY3E_07140 [Candidatus Tisiphia sp.]